MSDDAQTKAGARRDLPPAILLVDHGSRRAAANEQLEAIADRLRQREPGRIVHVAHMEVVPPTIAEGVAACVADGARLVIVHPYLLAPGRHSQEDIPAQCGAAAAAFPGVEVRVSPPLGIHDKILDVVLERVAEVSD
jgi:sirohydrochlorin ferrochelatase